MKNLLVVSSEHLARRLRPVFGDGWHVTAAGAVLVGMQFKDAVLAYGWGEHLSTAHEWLDLVKSRVTGEVVEL